ncbi:MAG TPA: CoA transferase [Flexivirga sp.]|uniref:CoA transferase n=1 Tax=Flexivirga sp. TaxID=1962927 RepID=UPI002C4CE136|nr:CoA transferase [Flexivirga sp.]HWC23119.1 CoA transferase [Flexivirga sp.]
MTWPKLPVPWATDELARGPRRWWDGPLDVEGLAVGSVAAAASAANALAAARNSPWRAFVPSGLVGASFGSIGRLRVAGEPVSGWGELSGFFRTADGWIRLHGNYPHHAAVIRSVLGVTDRSGAQSAIQEREAARLEETLRAAGGIAGAVRAPEVWRAHPHHAAAIEDRQLVSIGSSTGATRRLPSSTSLPLQGIRVLDLTRVIAGPTAARFLGALGADVLHIDRPTSPELLDQHLDTGFAKRTTTLDFGDEEGHTVARSLAGTADIVLTGYRPGALRRFGLDRESLLADHPHLVVVELSAWGDSGPWGGERGFDSIVQAVSGIATTYADADGTPGALPVQALDHATGYLMAAAALRLLTRRPHEGGGSARLALARTAEWLLHHPATATQVEETFDGPDCPLWLATSESTYGTIEYVRPPLFVGDVPLDFPSPPRRYGQDPPEWWLED